MLRISSTGHITRFNVLNIRRDFSCSFLCRLLSENVEKRENRVYYMRIMLEVLEEKNVTEIEFYSQIKVLSPQTFN